MKITINSNFWPGLGFVSCLFTYVVFHFSVMFVHELKKPHFYLGLIQKSLLVLYYFNGNPFLLHTIICLYNLKEKKGGIILYFTNGNNFPAVTIHLIVHLPNSFHDVPT